MVRTTETGGIKLIYNGVPTDGKCNNTGVASQLPVTKAFNSSSGSLPYVGYMYGTVYSSSDGLLNASHIYGNDVEYKNGQYTLKNTQTGYSAGLDNYHYTCESTSATCTSVKYIYYVESTTGYSITLNNGKKVEDALGEILDNNTTSSTIKGNKDTEGSIDNWYYTNIESKGYSSYLEDTVWCNDRNISSIGGWEPNGGSTSSYLYFKPRQRGYVEYKPNLACERPIDRFTVDSTNGNGSLDYPVGLLTVDEAMLAGARNNTTNRTYYLYTGEWWWLGSPHYFSSVFAYGFFVDSNGYLNDYSVSNGNGVRPVISLKPGTKFGDGDGTYANPYTISNPSKNNKLSDAVPGSYVKYVGNNGCSGKACEGQNANYVSDDDMGYCYNSSYKFTVNGWRIAYVADNTAYLVSAGASECLCTDSSGNPSNSSYSNSNYETTAGAPKHLANLNNAALKYCNSAYAYGDVCNSSSAWNMNVADFEKIVGKVLSRSSCYQSSNDTSCGYGNNLIDNGGYYWFATPYNSSSSNGVFAWHPNSRYVLIGISYGASGVRPVLRLKSSVVITGGDGTYVDPYIISPTIDKGTAE